jgi:succinate-semialdehyde dehydrogenase / glutarate-semialdehyde dehydrogenase
MTKENISRFAAHGCTLQNPSLLDSCGLLSGSWRPAASEKTFPVYEPSTGQILDYCANFEKADSVEAIDCAYDGYREFHAATTAKDRGVILRRWNDLILANIEDCMRFLYTLGRMTY